jgi:hypothetical protein
VNRHQTNLHPVVGPPAYRRAFERMDEALANASVDFTGYKIDLARRAVFGAVVDKLIESERRESERAKMPEE